MLSPKSPKYFTSFKVYLIIHSFIEQIFFSTDIFETGLAQSLLLGTGAATVMKTDVTPAPGGFLHYAVSSLFDLALSTSSDDPIAFDLQ